MAKGHTALLFTAPVHQITKALYLQQQQEEAPGGPAGVGTYRSTLVPWTFPICQSNTRKLPDQRLPTPPASTGLPTSLPRYLCRFCRYLGREAWRAVIARRERAIIGLSAGNKQIPNPKPWTLTVPSETRPVMRPLWPRSSHSNTLDVVLLGPIAQDERIGCTQQPASCPINQALHAPSLSALPGFAVRTRCSVPAPAPAHALTTHPPRNRLSFFVPAYERTGRTD